LTQDIFMVAAFRNAHSRGSPQGEQKMLTIRSRWRLAAIAALWFTDAAATTIPSSSTDVPISAYEHAQDLVSLPNGRHLNLFCLGTGTPVVVLEAGGGDDSLTFRRVQGRLSAVTRICSYDRAGLGFSDSSDAPSTAAHIVSDLHALITQAGIPRPVVLVGHSNGGLYASLYAADFPDEVAGMVMISPNNLGLDMAAEKVLDQPWLKQWRASDQADISLARRCLSLAEAGALARAPTRHPDCMDDPPNADPALHRLLNTQLARPSQQEALLSELLDTYPQADGGLSNAELTLQRAHFNFGDKPLVVLSGMNEQGDLPPAQRAKVMKAMLANYVDLAAHSTQGKQVFVDIGTEYVQTYRPNLVVQAVTEVVGNVRERAVGKPGYGTP
jgi:pimeloyl-ACP methyl ester carboxylesterase